MEHRGLIPARAGNTHHGKTQSRVTRAHPRSRGEHSLPAPIRMSRAGSSPLARGTPQVLEQRHRLVGLIPARAGNTCRDARRLANAGAHPRSRGEHRYCEQIARRVEGSSPLARGTLFFTGPVGGVTGLIPARAGNTSHGTGPSVQVTAHPRSRGEHGERMAHRAGGRGSSPLARGTPTAWGQKDTMAGLIPARAGNTP